MTRESHDNAELWREDLDSKLAIFADTLGYLADSNLPEDDRVNAVFCMLRESFTELQESIERNTEADMNTKNARDPGANTQYFYRVPREIHAPRLVYRGEYLGVDPTAPIATTLASNLEQGFNDK